jgi:hypothetical protein
MHKYLKYQNKRSILLFSYFENFPYKPRKVDRFSKSLTVDYLKSLFDKELQLHNIYS